MRIPGIPKEAFEALDETRQSMAEMLELLREIRDLLAAQQEPAAPIQTLHARKRRTDHKSEVL